MALSKCSKVFYCFCHCLLCIADLSVMGLTSYILAQFFKYKIFLPVILYWPAIIIIFFNITQFFGFWKGIIGILKENRTSIIILCTSIILNTIINLGASAWTLNIRNEIHDNINNIMHHLYGNYTKLQLKKEEWNTLQIQLKCCGKDGPQSFFKMGADFVPISCCNSTLNSRFCENGQFYKDGCLDALTTFVEEQQYHFILLILVFVIVQILGIGLFCNLSAVMNKNIEYKPGQQETLPLKRKS